MRVTATLNNNRTAYTNYVLTVVYMCDTANIVSAGLPNFYYDISAQESLSAWKYDWISTTPSSPYCG